MNVISILLGVGVLGWVLLYWIPNHIFNNTIRVFRERAAAGGFRQGFDKLLDQRLTRAKIERLEFDHRHVQAVYEEAREAKF